jgi:hypothetical protein
MIESKTITISMELSYHNVGQLLYGRAYFIWEYVSDDRKAAIWQEILKFAEESDDLPDLDQICEIVEKYY